MQRFEIYCRLQKTILRVSRNARTWEYVKTATRQKDHNPKWPRQEGQEDHAPGVGVTKPISSVPLFSEFFSIVKTHVNYIDNLYLTGVAAAELRWHLWSK